MHKTWYPPRFWPCPQSISGHMAPIEVPGLRWTMCIGQVGSLIEQGPSGVRAWQPRARDCPNRLTAWVFCSAEGFHVPSKAMIYAGFSLRCLQKVYCCLHNMAIPRGHIRYKLQILAWIASLVGMIVTSGYERCFTMSKPHTNLATPWQHGFHFQSNIFAHGLTGRELTMWSQLAVLGQEVGFNRPSGICYLAPPVSFLTRSSCTRSVSFFCSATMCYHRANMLDNHSDIRTIVGFTHIVIKLDI